MAISAERSLARAHAGLETKMRELAQQARGWFMSGSHSSHLRTRADGDTTHRFDKDLEDEILRFFCETGLPVRFSSEEREQDLDLVADPQYLALVDPLDGSHIAARGYPLCSISVSIVDLANGRPAASQIVEVFTGRLFTAYGTTALQDGQMIQPSSVRSVSDAMVVSYLASPSRLKRMATDIDKWSKFRLLLNYGGMLDIAKVGSGNCDAMVEATMGMVAREYIGGIHIATAAGAVASTLAGAPVPVLLDRDSKSDFVVSATPQLHEEILSLWR